MHVARIASLGGAGILLAFVMGTGCSSSSSPGAGGTDGGGDDSTASSSGASGSSSSSSSGTSSSSGSSSGTASSSSSGSSGGTEAGPEAGSSSGVAEGGTDGGCSGATPVALTVKNYFTWCSLTANGQAVTGTTPGSTTSSTVCVAAGTVNLVAKPLTGFELGPTPWHGTAGDTGTGDPGTQAMVDAGVNATSTTTVVVSSGTKCVWACCPFANGTGCTGVPNQCP